MLFLFEHFSSLLTLNINYLGSTMRVKEQVEDLRSVWDRIYLLSLFGLVSSISKMYFPLLVKCLSSY